MVSWCSINVKTYLQNFNTDLVVLREQIMTSISSLTGLKAVTTMEPVHRGDIQ